jgi:lipopolysaccharide transport system ATP-binding protein
MDPVFEVRGLTKVYRIYPNQKARLAEWVTRRPRHREVRALDGVSFTVAPGESWGIVGDNGAGKSTLLKIVTGCAFATAGTIRKRGTAAAILELGMGFHGEFSGRDNAALNAALLGLGPSRVRAALPRILEFAELGAAIDQPLKTYSSGMAMRLAFAVAVNVDPDVLIIDEALAVGDGYFQKKCIDAIRALQGDGRTILLCSHALYYVGALCQKALWLKEGRVEMAGAAREVALAYENYLNARKAPPAAAGRPPAEATPARIVSVRLMGSDGAQAERFGFGEPLAAEVEVECREPALPLRVGFVLFRNDEVEIFTAGSFDQPPLRGKGRYRCRLELDALPLVKGQYKPAFFVTDPEGLHVYHLRELPDGLLVVPPEGYRYFGIIHPPARWRLDI